MYKWKNYDFGYVCVNLCLFPQLNVDTFSTKRKKKSCRPCIYSFMEKSFFFFLIPVFLLQYSLAEIFRGIQ